ncbi:MAG TPA: lysylphosphatidylglycerol synthase transmembrane domain-containing protein [Candidatus Sumerlaeota bacterium]|nr:lysylphosphatidylglycerol synthase transmembrane domain-containing protein [Candidatus Sumerlaeota bacterium]HPK02091.1 lysylphosphatidylglycerol synthase transmembrane domain-containing protein [Candidatus Sumerlaeota bacterium]
MAGPVSRSLRWLRWIGPLLLILLILWAGPDRLWRAARAGNPWWLLFGWVLNFPQLGLKALRWQRIVRWQGIPLPYRNAFLSYFGSLLVGFLTPGRLGEMAKAFTLRHDYGVPLAAAFSSVILDRLFDLYLLMSLGALGIIRFGLVGSSLSWPIFIGLCALVFAPLLFLNEPVVRRLGGYLSGLGLLASRKALIQEKADQFATGLAVLGPARIAECVALTIAAYAVFFLQCYCCAWALGFYPGAVDMVLLMAATNFISFVPISISGLGTREACLIFFLARLAEPQSPATAVAFGLMLFLVLFVGGGFIGFICWQWAPIGLRRSAEEVKKRSADKTAEEYDRPGERRNSQ